MRADRNVWILGAGFSADAGVPTISSFLQTAREYFDAPSTPLPEYLEPHYKTVLQFRQAAKQSRDSLRLDLDDIETLFSLIDMLSLAEPRSTIARRNAESIKHVIAHTVTANRRTAHTYEIELATADLPKTRLEGAFLERYRKPTPADQSNTTFLRLDEYAFAAALIGGLFEPPDRQVEDSVITFNYDTVLEEAVWNLNGRVEYGISHVRTPGQRNSRGSGFAIPIFKLHGSSNWASPVVRGVRAELHDSYMDYGDRLVPLVVPPTWKKGDLAPTFAEIWRGAREAISRATRICIIGYSMPVTDPFFHHLMASALGENEGLYRLDVVDLWEKEAVCPTLRRYERVFEPLRSYGRLFSHHGGLGRFLSSAPTLVAALGRGECNQERNVVLGRLSTRGPTSSRRS